MADKFNPKGFVSFWVVYDNDCEAFWEGAGGEFWREKFDDADRVCLHGSVAETVLERLRGFDGWVDGVDAPLFYQELPTFEDVENAAAELHAELAWDAYKNDYDAIGGFLYVDFDGEVCHSDLDRAESLAQRVGYIYEPGVDGLTKYEIGSNSEPEDEYKAAVLNCTRKWVVEPTDEAYDRVLDELNFREITL